MNSPGNKLQDELELVEAPEDAILAEEADLAAIEIAGEANAPLVDPAVLTHLEQCALLVSLLFTAGERLENSRLADFLGLDARELLALAEEAAGSLRPLGLDILPAAEGLKLVSASHLDGWISEFHRDVRKARLSKSSLEVLAIVAYDQPVSRTQIEDIRQVNSESTVRGLLDRRLIGVAGRADSPGRPFLYRTTDYFLEVFGLASLTDLPPRPSSLRGTGDSDDDADLGPFVADETEPAG